MRREWNNQNISKIASLLLYRPFMLQIRFQLSFQRDDNWILISRKLKRAHSGKHETLENFKLHDYDYISDSTILLWAYEIH